MKILFVQLLILSILSLKSFASPLKLTKEEKDYILNNPIVTIGMMNNFPVFSYSQDSTTIGFEHDLLKIISLKTGLQFKKEINHWPLIYQAFKHKRTDMIASISLTEYRSQFTLYTEPYYDMPVIVFVRDDFGRYNGLKSLKDKKVGIIKNIFYEYKMSKLSDIKLVYYNDVKKLTKDLVFGKIDAITFNFPTIQNIIKENEYVNIIEAGELNLQKPNKEDLRFGIQSENILLHSIIQKSLNSISDKSYKKIHDKWNLDNYSKPINYALIFLIIIFAILLISVLIYLIMRKKNKQLEELAITDKLTNVYNRRKIENLIQTEINRSQKFKSNFALVILDIDYFKDVNDTYGHQIGDIVLRDFANILKETLRKTDFIGRFGGEEFMIICPEISENNIFNVIESLRLKIANFNFKNVGYKTASFGITSFKQNDTIETIIKRADDALYQAKNNGRNRIEVNF